MAEEKEKLCFVVGPIDDPETAPRNHSDFVLDFIIKPVMAKVPGYVVKRADEFGRPGMIDSQVFTALRDAELVIADLSCFLRNWNSPYGRKTDRAYAIGYRRNPLRREAF